MKRYPNGTLEGTPEELAAYDRAMAESPTLPPVVALPHRRPRGPIEPSVPEQPPRGWEPGKGPKASWGDWGDRPDGGIPWRIIWI